MIGRKAEQDELMRMYESNESEFVAIYGRRRVGKTYLVRQTYDGLFTFEHSGLANGNRKEQIQSFVASLRRAGLSVKEDPKNWLEAFELLKDLIRESSSETGGKCKECPVYWALNSVQPYVILR